MIKINYNVNTMRLTIKGHAGAAEAGHDIICAGVSAIFYNLVNVLSIYPKEAWDKEPEIKDENADALVKVYPSKLYRQTIAVEMRHALIGFDMIAKTHPKFVQLNVIPKKG